DAEHLPEETLAIRRGDVLERVAAERDVERLVGKGQVKPAGADEPRRTDRLPIDHHYLLVAKEVERGAVTPFAAADVEDAQATASRAPTVGPSAARRPFSIQSARSQRPEMVGNECETRRNVTPRSRNPFMRSVHFRWNSTSPTESTSSRRRMSGSMSVATAK